VSACARARETRKTSPARHRWMNRSSFFRRLPARARPTVRFRRLGISVDMWIACEQFLLASAAGGERGEDPARQHRPLRDESGEVRDRRRARIEQRERLVGRIDAAGGDEIEGVAESLARALDRKSTRLNSSHEWISYAVFW